MRDMLANKDDNPLSAGNKTFMLKDRIMQNLITDRNNAESNHTDTTPWDKAIGRLSGDYTSPDTRQFAPGFMGGQPIVQVGTSDQANAAVSTTNAGANAGVQVPTQSMPGASPSGTSTQLQTTALQQPAQPQQPQPVQTPLQFYTSGSD